MPVACLRYSWSLGNINRGVGKVAGDLDKLSRAKVRVSQTELREVLAVHCNLELLWISKDHHL